MTTLAIYILLFFFIESPDAFWSLIFLDFTAKFALFLFLRTSRLDNAKSPAKVIWLTGLSGAGKSTIAAAIHQKLLNASKPVQYLDGDTIREIFPSTGFSEAERIEHIRRIGYLASILEKNGINVVCAFISPHETARKFVRSLCNNFIEVYLSTPLEICESRDVKGLYCKARKGELKEFTGIDSPYEPPSNPELIIDTSQAAVSTAVEKILNRANLNY